MATHSGLMKGVVGGIDDMDIKFVKTMVVQDLMGVAAVWQRDLIHQENPISLEQLFLIFYSTIS